eukprot:gene11272-7836_t
MDRIASRFARAKQYTGEKLGRAEKTAYDEEFETFSNKTDSMKAQSEKILKSMSAYLEPNPNRRFEASVYARLKRTPREHVNEIEALGNSFLEAADAFGHDTNYDAHISGLFSFKLVLGVVEGGEAVAFTLATPRRTKLYLIRTSEVFFGMALHKAGETEVSVGARFSELTRSVQGAFMNPIKNFIQKDLKKVAAERKVLNTLRLDLDATKAKLKKTSPEKQQQVEVELMSKQTAFDDKYESVKLLLENVDRRHEETAGNLLALITAQQTYFETAAKELSDLVNYLKTDLTIKEPELPAISPNPNMTPLSADTVEPAPVEVATVRAKALVNRTADNDDELTITADEILVVFPDSSSLPDGWVLAESDGGKGRVPEDCIEISE